MNTFNNDTKDKNYCSMTAKGIIKENPENEPMRFD